MGRREGEGGSLGGSVNGESEGVGWGTVEWGWGVGERWWRLGASHPPPNLPLGRGEGLNWGRGRGIGEEREGGEQLGGGVNGDLGGGEAQEGAGLGRGCWGAALFVAEGDQLVEQFGVGGLAGAGVVL